MRKIGRFPALIYCLTKFRRPDNNVCERTGSLLVSPTALIPFRARSLFSREFNMSSNKKMIVRIVALLCACPTFAFAARAETQSLETLLAYLKSPIAGARRDAAPKLGERRVSNQLAVEALAVAGGKDEDGDVRAEALQSLGRIK